MKFSCVEKMKMTFSCGENDNGITITKNGVQNLWKQKFQHFMILLKGTIATFKDKIINVKY